MNHNFKIIATQNGMVCCESLESGQRLWLTADKNGQPLETPTFKAETYAQKAAFRGAVLVKQMRWAEDGRNRANRQGVAR